MAAGSRTASTCTPHTAVGTHTFKIAGYSHHKGHGSGRCIRSAAFTVGGYQWCIKYYPDGDGWSNKQYANRVQVYLELMTRSAEVRAHFDFRLVDHATGNSAPMHPSGTPTVVFKNVGCSGKNDEKGTYTWMTKSELEASSYLWDDCLIIQCNVTVKEPKVEDISPSPVSMLPSDLSKNLGKLLEEKRGTDVDFKVRDEVFPAHKIILAMRSPVFNAEFYGPMAENTSSGRYVEVEDMDPDVFRALLHFIYTDTVPPATMEDHDANNETRTDMIQDLLVAADRYAIDRLKLICEDILCKSLNVENVAATLALAELHHCSNLRYACVEFIASANRLDEVVASPGYMHLREVCPSVVVDMLEKVTKWMQHYKR